MDAMRMQQVFLAVSSSFRRFQKKNSRRGHEREADVRFNIANAVPSVRAATYQSNDA